MQNGCSDCKRPPSDDVASGQCLYRMADGRHFTQYTQSCGMFQALRDKHNLNTSYDTRMFLTQNAEKLMAENSQMSIAKTACPCFPHEAQGTMLPESEMIKCNASYCSFYGKDAEGLGLGRQFYTTG